MALSMKIGKTDFSRVTFGSSIIWGQNVVTARNVNAQNSGSTTIGDGIVMQETHLSQVFDPDCIDVKGINIPSSFTEKKRPIL